MNRMWEIRERDDRQRRYGMRNNDDKIEEAYECGFDEGYEKAMEEMKSRYGFRRSGGY